MLYYMHRAELLFKEKFCMKTNFVKNTHLLVILNWQQSIIMVIAYV